MPVPASLSLEELKRRLDKELDSDDDILEGYLEAAFLQAQAPVPHGCGRLLTPTPALVDGEDTASPVTLAFTVGGVGRSVVIPDAREITAVLVDGVADTSYVTMTKDGHIVQLRLSRPDSAPELGYAPASRTVEVTGRFGFVDIPEQLKDAIYTLAARAYYERSAQFADQVALAEGGGVQAYYRQLPPRAKLVFASFAIPAGIGGLA